MANNIKSMSVVFYAFVVLSLFLALCLAGPEVDVGRNNLVDLLKPKFPKEMPSSSFSSSIPSAVHCAEIYSVKTGDTCYAVYTAKNMTPRDFFAINPNVNCRKLFVGQWLCTAPVGGK